MKYKMLALDLDNTLLNDEHKISQQNIDSLQMAAKAGLIVVIATGRMYRSALPYARQLGIKVPLITYHGALIKTMNDGAEIWHKPVPLDVATEIAFYALERGYHLNVFVDDSLHVAEENDFTRYYQSIADIDLRVVGNIPAYLQQKKTPPTKISIISLVEDMEKIIEDLTNHFAGKVFLTQALPNFLEITHLEATKGRALRHLAEEWGVKREEVAAIGDNLNDMDMLEYAGTGVAVANAREELKKVAQVITLSNTDDGVSYFVEKWILNTKS